MLFSFLQTQALNNVLEGANNLLMDLEVVQSDVVQCFPKEIDVMHIFTTTYNELLENQVGLHAVDSSVYTIGAAHF